MDYVDKLPSRQWCIFTPPKWRIFTPPLTWTMIAECYNTRRDPKSCLVATRRDPKSPTPNHVDSLFGCHSYDD